MADSTAALINKTSDINETTIFSSEYTNESSYSTPSTSSMIQTTASSQQFADSMWFQISIVLIVVVVAVLVMFLICFIRQRRLLRKALNSTIRNIPATLPRSQKYSNAALDHIESSENIYSADSSSKNVQEDIGVQVYYVPNKKRKDSKCESGFESFPGSVLDRERNTSKCESAIGSVEGSIRDNRSKIDIYTEVHEKPVIFRSHQRTISEEDPVKVELELQKRDTTTKYEKENFEDKKESVNTLKVSAPEDTASISEEEYENVDAFKRVETLNNSYSDEETDEECSSNNLENPTYGIVTYDRKVIDNIPKENANDFNIELIADDNSPVYQNESNIRNENLNESSSSSQTKNFLNLNWTYKCEVNQNGGLIKAPNSDISLFLPERSIPVLTTTTIFWSIFSQDCEIKSRTNMDLCIVSPIVEYFTPYQKNFDDYVVIELPHCISEHVDDTVQPYWFLPTSTCAEKVEIHAIPRLREEDFRENRTLPEVFFFKNKSGYATIYTKHFSVYFCTCQQSFPLELYAVTFGKYVPIDHSQVNVKIKVHIADAKINLTDCLEALKQEEQNLGYTYKGKTEIDLDNEISGKDSIEIKVDFEDVPRNMNPIWKHSVDKEGHPIHPVSKSWQVGNRLKCGNHKFIQTTKEWQFKNESTPRYRTVFQCFIEIIYRKVIDYTNNSNQPLPGFYTGEAEGIIQSSTIDFNAMGHYRIDDIEAQYSTVIKSPVTTRTAESQNSHCIRTRMTVDIDLSDSVIENQESMGSLETFPSRRGVIPTIMYEVIDGLSDDKFEEMCRRLGADRELRSLKQSPNDSLNRGKKYELLENIREPLNDGHFCKEILTVLVKMNENKLRLHISDYIQRANQTTSHSVVNIEPQFANYQRLIPVQHADESVQENTNGSCIDENQTHEKTVNFGPVRRH